MRDSMAGLGRRLFFFAVWSLAAITGHLSALWVEVLWGETAGELASSLVTLGLVLAGGLFAGLVMLVEAIGRGKPS